VGNSKEREQLGRPRGRWEFNFKISPKEIGFVWIGLIWLRIGRNSGLF
jgi:hypothetical protein